MSSQGPNSPGTFADDSTVGTVAWSNPGNAAASDNVYAAPPVSLINVVTHYLRVTNFGFSIPAGATIDGVFVSIERSDFGATGNSGDSSVRLYTGSYVGDEKASATIWPGTDTYQDYGGSSDGWSASLTPAIVNASSFGIGISAIHGGTTQLLIDHVRITVYYSAGTTVTTSTVAGTTTIDTPTISIGGGTVSVTPTTFAAQASIPRPAEPTDVKPTLSVSIGRGTGWILGDE